MCVLGFKNEYNWVVKILKSSKSLQHVYVSDKLLFLLLKKWDCKINEDQKITFYDDFEIKKIKIIKKIKKITL